MANILEKTNGQVTTRGNLTLNDIAYIIRNVSGLTGEDAITTLNDLKLLFTIEPYAALMFGATVTWDALTGLNKTLEATGDFTLAITNHENGMSGDLSLTVTNPTTITLPAGSNVSGSFTAIESGDYLVKWDYDGTQFYFSIESGASSTTPAGATGDIQLNDGAGGLGVADVGVGRYTGNGSWTFGPDNTASGYSSFVAGGNSNTASGNYSSVVGGNMNTASGYSSFVAGGYMNGASGDNSSVVGGNINAASGNNSSVVGGNSNGADGNYSSVVGGNSNTASGDDSAVVGGNSNTASGDDSAVVGGTGNNASGDHSAAVGHSAIAKTTTEIAHGGGPNSERRMNVLSADSVNANSTLLDLADNTYFVLPAQRSGWAFKVKVVGVKDDGSSAAFFFEGCIQRKSDTTVSFAGTPLKTSYVDATLTGVDATVIANNTNKRLDIQVTGRAATNIRWTAVVDVAQSVWGAW